MKRSLLLSQGIYYLVTGVWPLLSRRTFEVVTGPKVDFWLVRTVGALVAVIGGVLTMAGVRGRAQPEVQALALGCAGAFPAVEVTYVTRGRISKVYLADVVVHLALLAGWALARGRAMTPEAPGVRERLEGVGAFGG